MLIHEPQQEDGFSKTDAVWHSLEKGFAQIRRSRKHSKGFSPGCPPPGTGAVIRLKSDYTAQASRGVEYAPFRVWRNSFKVECFPFNVEQISFRVEHSLFHIEQTFFKAEYSLFHIEWTFFKVEYSLFHIEQVSSAFLFRSVPTSTLFGVFVIYWL